MFNLLKTFGKPISVNLNSKNSTTGFGIVQKINNKKIEEFALTECSEAGFKKNDLISIWFVCSTAQTKINSISINNKTFLPISGCFDEYFGCWRMVAVLR